MMNLHPNFHDGLVDGLLTSERKARLFLRTAEGERFTLILRDVEALLVNNLRQGNIVLSITLLEPDELEESDICDAYQLSEVYMKTFVRERWVEESRQKGLQALEISPSYGCTLIAIFKCLEIRGDLIP